jgi:MerR family transcriptional regulator, light-induced transcriptional regulator
MDQHRALASREWSIAAVERDTGLGKDTLRVWERRYGFPMPTRDALGERVYTKDQVERLRFIKRLLDQGIRPKRLMALDLQTLKALVAQHLPTVPSVQTDLSLYIAHLKAHQQDDLRMCLLQAMTQKGLDAFVMDVVAPMTMWVGEAWMRGELEIFEEHLYTECVSGLLRREISHLQDQAQTQGPLVLLTTFPQEPHGLGLLMAESLLSVHRARCISLGTQMPLQDMVQAVQAHHADILALSFSASMNAKQVTEGLSALRQWLAPAVEIWVGGRQAGLLKDKYAGLRVLSQLQDIESALQDWRQRHEVH